MKTKILIVGGMLLAVCALGVWLTRVPQSSIKNKTTNGENSSTMNETNARAIAEKTCIKGGAALSAGTYNPNSKTWWFDANLNAAKPGCSPACVVSETEKTVEINWRCTGATPSNRPDRDPSSPKTTNFEECAAAGNPVMESYPRQCMDGGVTFIEQIETPPQVSQEISCPPKRGNEETKACIALYEPVCAKVNVQCFRAPCPPVDQTFGNSCEACNNPLVTKYTEGECA